MHRGIVWTATTGLRSAGVSSAGVHTLLWREITRVVFMVTEIPPTGERWTSLVFDVAWGHHLEVHEDAEGFTAALRYMVLRATTNAAADTVATAV